jgi:hypothetical protein
MDIKRLFPSILVRVFIGDQDTLSAAILLDEFIDEASFASLDLQGRHEKGVQLFRA